MICTSLNSDIPSLHEPDFSRIQNQLNFSFQNHTIVETHGSMRWREGSRLHVDQAKDCSAGYCDSWLIFEEVVVGSDVAFCIEVDGEFIGRVTQTESCSIRKFLPLERF